MKELKLIHFYGCYFISNPEIDEFLMVDIPNSKLRPIDPESFEIMELLQQIKEDLKEI